MISTTLFDRLAVCMFAASTAFFASSAFAEVKTITDVICREVKVDLPVKRVVVGFYFEDYMAVGGEKAYDSVVGISREAWEGWVPANWAMHTTHRPSLKEIADVVEAQRFSVEKVLSLNPDLVILADWQYKALGLDLRQEHVGRHGKALIG